MDKNKKASFVNEMNARLRKAHATFLVDYQGLNVEAMSRLRGELRKTGTEIQVVKNRLLRLASQDTDTASIKDHFTGPCALAITYEDVVGPAKVLVDLSKEFKELKPKMGQISGRPMDLEGIKRLAELPGKDQLVAQLLATMQAVSTSFVRVLNGVTVSLLNVLKAIEASKNSDVK